jgi:ribose transport system substrate-binding protein
MPKDRLLKHKPEQKAPYQIESVGRACRLLRILQNEGSLPLFELAELSLLSRPTVFRLMTTLQTNGMVVKDGSRKYRLAGGFSPGRRYKIGYLAETGETSFYRAVFRGLSECAERAGLDLVALNSQSSLDVALENTETLLAENVDLIMIFQSYAQIASVIATRTRNRRMPLIAIEMPHPNAIYFGVDNCHAGLTAGRYLAHWAEQHWRGQVDEILLIGSHRTGSLPEARLTGSLLGIHEVLPNSEQARISTLNGDWQFEMSFEAVSRHLRKSKSTRILVSAIFDPSALGALQAFKDADRLQDCAIVGQNGSIEARLQMRKPNSRLIGSVAYFPERYGEQLVALALDILTQRTQVPNAVFIKHQLITPNNLQQHYGRETKSAKSASTERPLPAASD